MKLGFEADADVPVHRAEVWERIQAGRPLDGRPEDSATLDSGCDQKKTKKFFTGRLTSWCPRATCPAEPPFAKE